MYSMEKINDMHSSTLNFLNFHRLKQVIKTAAKNLNYKIFDDKTSDTGIPRLPIVHKLSTIQKKGCRIFYETIKARVWTKNNTSECKKKWQDFVDNYDSHLYFRYNNTSKEFEIIDVKGNPISNKGNKLRKKVQTYLLAVGEANLKMAMALFDFLNDVLPAGVISKNLQLNVSDQQSGKNKQINIIDLLFYVTLDIK